jgi:hypothetical protein
VATPARTACVLAAWTALAACADLIGVDAISYRENDDAADVTRDAADVTRDAADATADAADATVDSTPDAADAIADAADAAEGSSRPRDAAHFDAPFLATAISAGAAHTCALDIAGQLYCWGANGSYQLGDDNPSDLPWPNAPLSGRTFTYVATGATHSCVATATSTTCFGANDHGQLGTGDTSDVRLHQMNAGGPLATGDGFTCQIHDGGATSCWGNDNSGQLGNLEAGLAGQVLSVVSAGSSHACGIRGSHQDGLCWGAGSEGQLGDGLMHAVSGPVIVQGGMFAQIAAGAHHTCAIQAPGTQLACWGANQSGEVGKDGGPQYKPVNVTGVQATNIAAGDQFTCAITNDAGIQCWGLNDRGQLGVPPTLLRTSTPVAVPLAGKPHEITAGGAHACALVEDTNGRDVVFCWGANDHGQLGDGTAGPGASAGPTRVLGP